MAMPTLKEIREVEADSMTIQLPAALLHHVVEVTVRSLDQEETVGEDKESTWPPGFLDEFFGCVPDFPDPESEGEYEVREPM